MRRIVRGSLFVTCIGIINLISAHGIPARGDVVTDWNNAALDAIRAGNTAPPIASRSLAILHAAIYDAVNGIARTHEPYLVPSGVPASASREAAASAAAHATLVNLFPARTSSFNALHAAILATISNGPQKTAGINWGEFVASQILAARANDGSTAVVQPPGGSGPGVWIPTPPAFLAYLLPQWGFVVPFAMSSSSQFRPPGPPALSIASSTLRTMRRSNNWAQPWVQLARQIRLRSLCFGLMARAPKHLRAIGTALGRSSAQGEA